MSDVLTSLISSTSPLLAATVVAAESDPATTAGLVIGRLLFFVVGGLLLFFGLRHRSASQRDPARKSRGKGLIIAGSVVLVLSVLALASVSATG